MKALRRFAAIVHADLRERSRATRFWVVMGLLGALTWLCFPPLGVDYVTVGFEAARGRYSSAWIGMVLALMYSTTLSLFGFYLVRGTLVRDFETRVWQLLVATPMTRGSFLLAKWCSHMAVFALLIGIGLGVGLVAQWYRGEVREYDLWQLLQPSLWIAMPALAVTAFLAVLFDMLPWLRRSAGNVLYFVVWILLFIAAFGGVDQPGVPAAGTLWLSDPAGVGLATRDIREVLAVSQPGLEIGGLNIGMSIVEGKIGSFDWPAWSPGGMDILGRLLWPMGCLVGLLALAPLLDWSAARTASAAERSSGGAGLRLRWLDPVLRPLEHFAFGRLFAAELKLILRQRQRRWWLFLLGACALQVLASGAGQATGVLLGWLLLLDVFARAVLREQEGGTAALVLSAPDARWRLLGVRLAVALTLA
ncbi:MAG TPA: hypothetical protein VFY12_12045, partial [Arenimonas sp.]|nr:hypothetical protein [Arenimonas sp.]